MDGGEDGQLVFMQSGEPGGLYCADETDGESLRVCEQIKESLYGYEVGGLARAGLATECTANEDLTLDLHPARGRDVPRWLDAGRQRRRPQLRGQWDAASPLHVGRTGAFAYWPALLGWLPEPGLSPPSSIL